MNSFLFITFTLNITVIAQQWSVKIVASPAHLSPRAGPILLKCEVDLMGGGREFVQVTGWKRDQKFITQGSQRLYGEFYSAMVLNSVFDTLVM